MQKVTKEVMARIQRPGGTIGQLEALAGLPADEASRRAFWVECARIARARHRVRYADGNQVFAVARQRCHALIIERVEAGQLSIL